MARAPRVPTDDAFDWYPWCWQIARSDRRWLALNWYQRGALRELLDECWIEGGIPDDPRALMIVVQCSASEFNSMWPVLRPFFLVTLANGRLTSRRLEKIRAHRQLLSRNGRLAGIKGARRRWALVRERALLLADPTPIPVSRKEKLPRFDTDQEAIAVARWNAFAARSDFPLITTYGHSRRAALRQRLREPGWFEQMEAALLFLEASAYHRSRRMTFDIFLRPGRVTKYATSQTDPEARVVAV